MDYYLGERQSPSSLTAGERALPPGLGVAEGVGAVGEGAVARQKTEVLFKEKKQDGNPYNGPSAIMVKVKPVGQVVQNGPVGQDGPVGQNGYPQDLYLYSDHQNLWLFLGLSLPV